VLTYLVGQHGNQYDVGQVRPSRSHGGDMVHEKGINTHILAQIILHTGSRRIPSPLLPPLLEEKPIGAHMKQGQDDDFTTYFMEY